MSLLEINVQAKKLVIKPAYTTVAAEIIKKHYILQRMVGSRFICDPAPEDTDEDWLVWVMPEEFKQCIQELVELGWEVQGKDVYGLGGSFSSLKHKDSKINYILTKSGDFYTAFETSAKICKMFNVKDKELRIKIHDMIIGMVDE